MKKASPVVPVILAAGMSPHLGFPQALARFDNRTAVEIAVANCTGLPPPVVVLGSQAERIRPAVPRRAQVVVNRRWRAGQLSSLLAGLRCLPREAACLLYPVDYPLLTRALVRRLVRAYRTRRRPYKIVAPAFRERPGHPVIFSPELRQELKRARTAKEVLYRDSRRVRLFPVATAAVHRDFHDSASYRLRRREFRRRATR